MALHPIDVVHLNVSNRASAARKVILFYIAQAFRKRVIVHFHSGDSDMGSRRLDVMIVRHLCRRADRVVAVGERWRQAISAAAGINHANISVIRNSILDFGSGAKIPRPNEPKLAILFAGKVGADKGVDILIKALAELAVSTTAWQCTIAGDGRMETYADQVASLGIADKITFTGWIAAEKVHELMKSSDVVVLPSRGEALPVCLVEGACAGAALVATNVGSVTEVLEHGINGYIVQPDPQDLCKALAALVQNPIILQRMQVASRRIYLDRFRIEQMAEQLSAAFRDVATCDRMHRRPGYRLSGTSSY
jgi:glycosyltransferase involved in cell wall biosynthesis